MNSPWMKFYPADWRADPALRMCSIAARGFWMEMLCLMHEAQPRGFLLINGNPVSNRQLAGLAGLPLREATTLLAELSDAGVFSREDNGTVYSRRMRRDQEKAEKDKANGKGGGNPALKRGVNPPDNGLDKAQKLEARKSSEASASGGEPPSADPTIEKRALFERGKEVFGPKAGGLLADLVRTKGGNIAMARAAVEQASQAHNPLEYLNRILKPKANGAENAADVISAGARLVERARAAERGEMHPELRSGSGGPDVRLLAASGRG